MTDKDVLQNVANVLSGLGAEPKRIATLLKMMGIKGRIGDPQCCPLARYVLKQTGINILIGDTEITLATKWYPSVPTPLACELFINRFDTGNYPDLIEAD